MMTRRNLLQSTGAAILAGAAGSFLPLSRARAAADDWSAAFHAAEETKPWLIGFENPANERLETPALAIEGKLPADLVGTFYRNGPAQHERAGQRYHHWFDGDGMVQAFRFDGKAISHRGRFVATAKRREESAAGRFLYPGFGTVLPGMRPVTSADAMNVANINILPLADELLALWEGGSAYGLDPTTLETRGVKTWEPDLAGMPFSAHPKVGPGGTVWNFGHSAMAGALILYRIDAAGQLMDKALHRLQGLGMIHDFAVSRRHLIFVVPPLVQDTSLMRQGASFLDSHQWRPDIGTRVLVFHKNDLSSMREFQLPAEFLFHFGNAWEDDSGVIRVTYCRSDDASVAFETTRYVMRGKARPAHTPPTLTTARIDLARGTVAEEHSLRIAEFPRVDPRYATQHARQLFAATQGKGDSTPLFNAVQRIDVDGGAADAFDYGPDMMAEEHIFVPRPGSTKEAEGWLIGTALDVRRRVTQLAVFEATNLAAGPIAIGRLPYVLPLGLHGNFKTA